MASNPTNHQSSHLSEPCPSEQHGSAAERDLTLRGSLVEQVKSLRPWFHNLNLQGIETAPEHFLGNYPAVKWRAFEHQLPDFTGKAVLDVGCNAGFHSFEALRRGAKHVLGVDHDPHYLKQAALAARVLQLSHIELRELDVYNLPQLNQQFDFVMCMGVMYHLRYPLLALDNLRRVVGGQMLFQSLTRGFAEPYPVSPDYPFEEERHFNEPGYPKLQFIEHAFAGDPSNWWIPNRACTEAMLRSAGFRIEKRLTEDVYLCAAD